MLTDGTSHMDIVLGDADCARILQFGIRAVQASNHHPSAHGANQARPSSADAYGYTQMPQITFTADLRLCEYHICSVCHYLLSTVEQHV